MRKKIYSFSAAALLAAIFLSSCQKENLKPNQTLKQESASSGAVSGATAPGSSSDSYNSNTHPTCPNHGG
jgi:hypothetical protein